MYIPAHNLGNLEGRLVQLSLLLWQQRMFVTLQTRARNTPCFIGSLKCLLPLSTIGLHSTTRVPILRQLLPVGIADTEGWTSVPLRYLRIPIKKWSRSRQAMKLHVDPSVVREFRDEFGPGWTLEDDRRFWRKIQAGKGLRGLKKDARSLEALCRGLSAHPTDREFMRERLRIMRLVLGLHQLESTARIIYQQLPHFSARFAAEIFCEMAGRAELILEEKAPHLLGIFGETDDQTVHTGKNCAAAGGAAR
jgi:hypothetical protein